MTNAQKFEEQLTKEYQDLFTNDLEYSFAKSRTTPEALAKKMTAGLISGSANHDGEGIKRTCKNLGIKATRKSIVEFLKM